MSNGKIWLALPFVAATLGMAALGALMVAEGSAQAANSSTAAGPSAGNTGFLTGNNVHIPVNTGLSPCSSAAPGPGCLR